MVSDGEGRRQSGYEWPPAPPFWGGGGQKGPRRRTGVRTHVDELQRYDLAGGYVAGRLQAGGRIDDALFGPLFARVLRLDRHDHGGGRVVVAPRHDRLAVERRRRMQGARLAGRQDERALEPQQPPVPVGDGDVPLPVRVAQLERQLLVAVRDPAALRHQAPQHLVVMVHRHVHRVALLHEHRHHLNGRRSYVRRRIRVLSGGWGWGWGVGREKECDTKN